MNNDTLGGLVSSAQFGPADYTVFGIMLSMSLSIGVYFGFCGKGSDSTDEYLLGGRQMKTVPIAISLVASQLSGISVMTLPAEMYAYGTQFAILVPIMIFVTAIVVYIFIPVFYSLNLANCYEYLQLRFDKKVRELVCAMFILNLYLILPIVIFVPALAFAQVSNLNIHLINGVICMICVVYTMLGGIKAVVWTDVMQAGVMVTSCVAVAAMGVYNAGGVAEVWRRNEEGGRIIFFNLDPSPTARTSLWNISTGSLTLWSAYVGLSQSCVQRYVALPSMRQAQKAMWLFYVGFFVIMSLNLYTGLIMFAAYHDCDPIKLGIVEKADQLMPYFVSQTVGHLPGMPGVFIACVFSAALSTMSASLNSMSGIIYEEYLRKLNWFEHTEHRANLAMKCVVLITGCYCIVAGAIVEQFEHILQVVTLVVGITTGATLGSFTLGMLAPRCGPRGALYGSLTSLALMLWIAIGSQIAILSGRLSYPKLPTSIEGCSVSNATSGGDDYFGMSSIYDDVNSTSTESETPTDDSVFFLYKLSFNYFCGVGTAITWIVGLTVSYIWDNEDPLHKDRRLYAPCVQRFLPKPAEGQTKALEIIKVDDMCNKQHQQNNDGKSDADDSGNKKPWKNCEDSARKEESLHSKKPADLEKILANRNGKLNDKNNSTANGGDYVCLHEENERNDAQENAPSNVAKGGYTKVNQEEDCCQNCGQDLDNIKMNSETNANNNTLKNNEKTNNNCNGTNTLTEDSDQRHSNDDVKTNQQTYAIISNNGDFATNTTKNNEKCRMHHQEDNRNNKTSDCMRNEIERNCEYTKLACGQRIEENLNYVDADAADGDEEGTGQRSDSNERQKETETGGRGLYRVLEQDETTDGAEKKPQRGFTNGH